MASMWACCAAPAQSGAAVETVPMDFHAESRVRSPAGSGQARTLLTKVDALVKRGFEHDARDDASSRLRSTSPRGNDGRRFDKFDRQLAAPTWGRDERWCRPQNRRRDWGNDMNSPLENNKEERLKELMAEFRPMLASGIRVDMVDAATQLVSQCMCKVDAAAQTVHLTSAFMDEQVFNIRDMTVFKGNEFARKVPGLAHASSKCLGIEFPGDRSIEEPACLHFEDTAERNDFYAFMKIMRMTAESVGGGSSNARSRR